MRCAESDNVKQNGAGHDGHTDNGESEIKIVPDESTDPSLEHEPAPTAIRGESNTDSTAAHKSIDSAAR